MAIIKKDYVNAIIDDVLGSEIQLGGYYTKEQIDKLLEGFTPDMSQYFTREEILAMIPDYNTFYTREEANDWAEAFTKKLEKYYTKEQIEERLAEASFDNYYTKSEINAQLALKASLSQTYTRKEIDGKIIDAISGKTIDLSNYPTNDEMNTAISTAVDAVDHYTKDETDMAIETAVAEVPQPDLTPYALKDQVYSKDESYPKTELYTRDEIDAMPAGTDETRVGEIIAEAIGDKELLTTSNKDTLVNAINELDVDIVTNTAELARVENNVFTKDEINTKLDTLTAAIPDAYTKAEDDAIMDKAMNGVTTRTQRIIYTKSPVSDHAAIGDEVIQYNTSSASGDITAKGTIIELDDGGTGRGITIQLESGEFYRTYKTSIRGVSPYTIQDVVAVVSTTTGGVYTREQVDAKLANISTGDVDLSGYYTKDETNTKLADYASKASLNSYALLTDVTSMLRWKGVLATYAELEAITDAATGDTYTITEKNNANYTWTGIAWTDYPAAESLSESQVSTLVDNKLAGSYFTQDETQAIAYSVATGRCDDYQERMKTYVAEQIAGIDTSKIDLSNYSTTAQMNTAISDAVARVSQPDLTPYALKTEVTAVDTKLTTAIAKHGDMALLTTSNKDTLVNAINELDVDIVTNTSEIARVEANVYTKAETDKLIDAIPKLDASQYYNKTEIEQSVAAATALQLSINEDANYRVQVFQWKVNANTTRDTYNCLAMMYLYYGEGQRLYYSVASTSSGFAQCTLYSDSTKLNKVGVVNIQNNQSWQYGDMANLIDVDSIVGGSNYTDFNIVAAKPVGADILTMSFKMSPGFTITKMSYLPYSNLGNLRVPFSAYDFYYNNTLINSFTNPYTTSVECENNALVETYEFAADTTTGTGGGTSVTLENYYTKAETDALIKAAVAAIQTDTLGQRATFDVLTSIKKQITNTTPNMIALKKLVNNASGGDISSVLMNQETILFTGVKHNTYGSALGYLYFTDSNGETYTAVPTTSTAKSAYVSFYKTSAYTANPLVANVAFQVYLTSTSTYENAEYYYVAYALHPNYRVNDIFSSSYKNDDYWMASSLANYQINILAVDLAELEGITHLNLHYSGGSSGRYSTQLNVSVTDGISNTELTTWSDTALKGGAANVVTHQLPIVSYTTDKINELIESIYKEYGL